MTISINSQEILIRKLRRIVVKNTFVMVCGEPLINDLGAISSIMLVPATS